MDFYYNDVNSQNIINWNVNASQLYLPWLLGRHDNKYCWHAHGTKASTKHSRSLSLLLKFNHSQCKNVWAGLSLNLLNSQWASVNHQMAVPVPSMSCCVFNSNYFFYQEPNELAFNRDTCCHLVICLWLIASHCIYIVYCKIAATTISKTCHST